MRTLAICSLLTIVQCNTEIGLEQTSLLQKKIASSVDISAERSAGCQDGSSGCLPETTTTTTCTTTTTTVADAIPSVCNAEMHEPVRGQECISGVFDTTVDFTKSHAVHFQLRMPDADTVDDKHERQWLFSAAKARGTEHWLWSPTGQFGENKHGHIQFGVWSGPQIKNFEGSDTTKSDILEATSLTAVYNADAGEYKLYMNGREVQTIDGVDFIMPEKKLYLGVFPHAPTADTRGTQSKFTGCIEKVQVFDRDLLAGEVDALDSSPTACTDATTTTTTMVDVPSTNCPTPDDAYTCHFWGDPHFTHLFFMEKKQDYVEAQKGGRMAHASKKLVDFNSAGVFNLATSSDGDFEAQAFFCPAYSGTTNGAAVAMKIGNDVIQIVRGDVTAPKSEDPKDEYYWADLRTGPEEDIMEFYVNGDRIPWSELGDATGTRGKDVTGSGGMAFVSSFMQQLKPEMDRDNKRLMVPVCAGDGGSNLVEMGAPYLDPPKKGKRGRLFAPSVTIRSNNPGGDGICSSDVATIKGDGEQFRVAATEILFSAEQMKSLCGMCRLEMVDGACGAPGHSVSAEDVCKAAGVDLDAAKRECGKEFEKGTDWFFTCVMETCADGEAAVSISKEEQQLAEEMAEPAATTTTTTKLSAEPAPPVNPKATCSGVGCETVCAGSVLHFEGGNIVENTLAGSGLSGGGRMKIVDVAEGVDLYISDTGSEQAFDMTSAQYGSGYSRGAWMKGKTGIYEKKGEEKEALRIAMEKTGTYEFKFELKNKHGDAVALDEFPLVFYDIDHREGVESCDHSGTVITDDTDLTKDSYDDWNTGAVCTKIYAGHKSAESPDDFDHPTEDQRKASAAFVYENKSEWRMKFSLEGSSHRWFLFKSSKGLTCQ